MMTPFCKHLFSVALEPACKFNMQLKSCSFGASDIMLYKAQNIEKVSDALMFEEEKSRGDLTFQVADAFQYLSVSVSWITVGCHQTPPFFMALW